MRKKKKSTTGKKGEEEVPLLSHTYNIDIVKYLYGKKIVFIPPSRREGNEEAGGKKKV
jgi:hypothetical protein